MVQYSIRVILKNEGGKSPSISMIFLLQIDKKFVLVLNESDLCSIRVKEKNNIFSHDDDF